VTVPNVPDDYQGGPALPLVPQVEYPFDHETDDQLRAARDAAVEANDPRAEVEAVLDLAHRAMVRRDALLGELVAGAQAGDGNKVLHRADLYAFWQGAMERTVESAGSIARRVPEAEAER
jgi:hypothetical protein